MKSTIDKNGIESFEFGQRVVTQEIPFKEIEMGSTVYFYMSMGEIEIKVHGAIRRNTWGGFSVEIGNITGENFAYVNFEEKNVLKVERSVCGTQIILR
jgi:hypothetical protein